MTKTRLKRAMRYSLAASVAALVAAGGLVEPSGRDVRIDLPSGGSVEVGAWRVGGSIVGLALGQSAQGVTLDNVTVTVDTVTYRMPRIVFEGTSLSRAELMALFDTKAPEPLHARLARLSATRITAPRLEMTQKAKDASATYAYSNIVLENVAAGRIASGTAEGGTFEVKEEDEVSGKGEHGRLTLKDIDLTFAARMYAEAGGPSAEMRTIYGLIALENLTFTDDESATVRIGRLSATDVRARLTNPSWGEMSKAMAALESGDKAPKEDQAKILRLVGEMFGAMSVAQMEMTDIIGTDEEDKDSRMTVSRVAYLGGGVGETRIEGVAVTSSEGSVRLGLLSFRGFSLGPVMEGLQRIAGKSESDLTAAELRGLVPTLGTTRLVDLTMDLPSTSDPDDVKKRNRVSVREASIEPGPQRNGIPTSLKLGVSNLTADLTPDLQDSGLKVLSDMGYRSVDLSWTASAAWKEETKELAIEDFAVSGRDMGRIAVRATAGDVGPDVFNPDSAIALVSLLGASARSLEVTVQNGGLYERLLAQEAKTKRKSPDSLRAEYGAMATLGIPMMLGGTPQARSVGETVGRFLAKPGTLRLSATPKDPRGLGVTELMSVRDPMGLLQRVDIKATQD